MIVVVIGGGGAGRSKENEASKQAKSDWISERRRVANSSLCLLMKKVSEKS
jgi:pyruvate/2-oxoglutarate dehydrogenase complex dihydrolipoamide dehydrogenase (E3) component